MYSAYLDRFTDTDQALILVEDLQKEFLVPVSNLPTGSQAGTWFVVDIQNDNITSLQINEKKTRDMQDDIKNRMQRLQSSKKSRFK